jgi:hypothetical protein
MAVPGYISLQQAREALRSIYRSDTESNLEKALLESLSDGIKPVDDKGNWKPSPILLLIAALVLALAGVFLYFSVGGRP